MCWSFSWRSSDASRRFRPSGSIGYPGEPEGIQHFETMLRSTARRLGDSQIDSLMRALGNK